MRLIERICLSALLLLVAACGSGGPVADATVDVGDLNAVATAGPTVAEVLAQGNDSVATPAEPKPTAFDQTGRWAATPALCARGAWRFAKDGVETDGETSCRTRSTHVASNSSQRLEMACTSEGLKTIESWALNLRDDGSMTVSRSEGGNGVPRSVTLRRCG